MKPGRALVDNEEETKRRSGGARTHGRGTSAQRSATAAVGVQGGNGAHGSGAATGKGGASCSGMAGAALSLERAGGIHRPQHGGSGKRHGRTAKKRQH